MKFHNKVFIYNLNESIRDSKLQMTYFDNRNEGFSGRMGT